MTNSKVTRRGLQMEYPILSEHPALKKFKDMKSSFDCEGLVQFAVRAGHATDEVSARRNLDGVLLWLACHAVKEHAEQPYVMMNGPVDEMYHALILNTRTYLHLCREYIGFFIHHTPVNDVEADKIKVVGGITYTIDFLQRAFGSELAPALCRWVDAHDSGELHASSVSCLANDYDAAPDALLGITDFRTFWDRNRDFAGTA